jgi:hypothetical protein
MSVSQHEFPESDGERRCLHCGGLWRSGITATCIQRAIPANQLMPEPKRREYASEAFDEIYKRLVEVMKESLPVAELSDI